MTVRRAQPEDLPELVSLNLQVQDLHLASEPKFFRSSSEADVERFLREALEDDQKVVLVACDGGKPVGYLLAEIRERPENPFMPQRRWFQIDQIGVDARCRRRGHGRSLVEKAMSYAKELEIDDLQAGVWAFNEPSLSLFRSSGFRDMDIRLQRQVPGAE